MHALAVIALALLLSNGQGAEPGRQRPREAIGAILDAFERHAVVALEEHHGDERAHAFRVALLRHPRFSAAVRDIVVEFGNSRYQSVIDRFVDGDAVPDADLRRVWQNTTQAHTIWDRPIYEDFFRAARRVTASLAADQRVRVLLGDPPIDWDAVRTAEDFRTSRRTDRSRHPADVVLREVVAKRRRALVIYGAMHLMRQNPLQGPNLVDHLEARGVKTFVVIGHPLVSLTGLGIDPASWTPPVVMLTAGSRLAGQVDAVLYLGPSSGKTSSPLPASLCSDRDYRAMRVARMTLAGDPDAASTLARECAAARPDFQAAQKPDFSGTWIPGDAGKPAPPPSTQAGPPPPPRTLSLTITHSPAEMKIDRRMDTAGRETTSTFIYKLDGSKNVNQMGPLVFDTTAEWQGEKLVLSSNVSADGSQIGTLREVYGIDNGDLIVETTRSSPAGVFSSRTVHKKQ